ncbi:MAG: hypothetical protein AAB229_07100 [Candidatus Hydrogenedentota bacterium]
MIGTSLLALTLLSPASAQTYRPGAVLLEPIGARSLGLGNAVTALGDDITAIYSNPAGLSSIDNAEVMVDMGRTLSRDIWASGAGAIPVGRKATVAASVDGFTINQDVGISRLDNDFRYRARPLGLDENNYIGRIAAARTIRPDLSIGVAASYLNFRSLSQQVLRENYQGLYGNFGIRYNSALKGFVLGASVMNVGGRISGAKDPDLPVTGSLGVSYGFLRKTADYINLTGDLVQVENEPLTFRAGAEYWWANVLGVRAGYDGTAARRKENPHGGEWRGGLSASVGGAFVDVVLLPNTGRMEDFGLAASIRMGFGPPRRR